MKIMNLPSINLSPELSRKEKEFLRVFREELKILRYSIGFYVFLIDIEHVKSVINLIKLLF